MFQLEGCFEPKKKKKNDDDNERKMEEPKGDGYIVIPYLRQRVEKL